MEQAIFLSVIIPVYNGEKYIVRIMEMLEKQSFRQFEVIIVDDGSEDRSYDICKEYEKKYSYIRVLHTKNKGVSHARNTGIRYAKGKWLHFIDVDDVINPEMFFEFYNTLKDKKNIGSIVCGCMRKNELSGECVYCGPQNDKYFSGEQYFEAFNYMKMEQRYWMLDYIWNKWYRKDIIDRENIRFCEKLSLGEDFVFNTEYFSCVSSVFILSKAYYEYEINENGLVSRFLNKPWETREVIFDCHKKLYKNLGIWDENKDNIRIQTGEMFWGDLRRINSKNCHYTMAQKISFICKMEESSLFPMIFDYLDTRAGVVFKIYKKILRKRDEKLAFLLISLEKFACKRMRVKNT